MDGGRGPSHAQADVEILVAQRRAGLHLGRLWGGCSIHDHRVAARRLSRPHPALAVLHAAAETPAAMEPGSDLVLGSRHVRCHPGRHHRDLDVLAFQALPQCRRGDEHSLPRTEALAHRAGADLRNGHRDVGLQRHALDGPLSGEDGRPGWKPRQPQRRDSPGASRRHANRGFFRQAPEGGAGAAREPRRQGAGIYDVRGRGRLPGQTGVGRNAHRAGGWRAGLRIRSPADHRCRHEGGWARRPVGNRRDRTVRHGTTSIGAGSVHCR